MTPMTPQMPCLKLTPAPGPQCPKQLRRTLEEKLARLGYGRITFIEEGPDLLVTARMGMWCWARSMTCPAGR